MRGLRARLLAAYTLATGAVLLGVGLVVFLLFTRELRTSVDAELQAFRGAVTPLVAGTTTSRQIRGEAGERLLQLYAPGGALLAGSSGLHDLRLLTVAQVVRGRRGAFFADVGAVPGQGRTRVLVFPAGGGRSVAVVGQALTRVDHLAHRLAVLLAIALPAALLLAAVIGFRLAGATLRPVERMRARAAEINDTDLSQRLPLPGSGDEIQRLGQTFNDLLGRLAAAFARERRIVSDASHELRSPLAVLSAELQVAARADRTEAQLRETVLSALEETGRLTRLAEDLLVLARSDEGRLPLRVEPVDVHDVLRDLERRSGALAAAAGRRLDARVAIDGGAVVLADPARLAQVLDNLVANALGHGAGTVTVRATLAPGGVAFTVEDEGPGFGAARDGAFERFMQGDASRGGGSGLGLAIVQAIAAAHGGTATAQDRPGGGARVTVVVPEA